MLFPWDSADKSAVSGTGYGLAGGLEELGVDVVRVHGRPPRRVLGLIARGTKMRWRVAERHVGSTWRSGIESTSARNVAARIGLRRGGSVDGIVQLASDFLIRRPGIPLITYDDMTIRQAVEVGYPAWRLAQRDLKWRIERQAASYRGAVACCTRSDWTASSIRSDYGIEAAKVKVVGVGCNRHFASAPQRSWETPTFLIVAADWDARTALVSSPRSRKCAATIPRLGCTSSGGIRGSTRRESRRTGS